MSRYKVSVIRLGYIEVEASTEKETPVVCYGYLPCYDLLFFHLLLNPQKLIVLCRPFPPAGRPGFD